MRKQQITKWMYTVCMSAALLIVAGMCLHGVMAQRPVITHYSSEHPASTLPPMMGLSPDSVLNTGDAAELDMLPGVGEVIAQRIIDLRQQINGFRIPEDLLLVRGIGEKSLDKLMNALPDALAPLAPISHFGTDKD